MRIWIAGDRAGPTGASMTRRQVAAMFAEENPAVKTGKQWGFDALGYFFGGCPSARGVAPCIR